MYDGVKSALSDGKIVDGLWIRVGSSNDCDYCIFTMGFHVRGNGKAGEKKSKEWEWIKVCSNWFAYGRDYDWFQRDCYYGECFICPESEKS